MYVILCWNQTLLIFHKRAHNTKQQYINQNIQLIKIYNFYINFPICQVFKRNYTVFHEFCTDCCTPFHSCFNSFWISCNNRSILFSSSNFWINPCIVYSTEAICKVLLLRMRVLHYTFTITTQHWSSVYEICSLCNCTSGLLSNTSHKILSFTAWKVHLVNAQWIRHKTTSCSIKPQSTGILNL
jgi:hypothetical protein